jgi:1-deoxy-D-xylulose-5-phosphate reductoisomerase
MAHKRVVILGSTGSIGTSALKIVSNHPEEFSIVGLAAHSNIDLLEKQVDQYHPKKVAVFDEKKAKELQERLPGVSVVSGMEGICEIASDLDADYVLCAMTGSAGIAPTVAAIQSGKQIGLANKEVLVSAGEYIVALAKEKNIQILPVDSEHSALFQCLDGEDKETVGRLILTASGGPFKNFSAEQFDAITPQMALAHPNWAMGPKVTVDCSTLMNKGLEVIEAHFLYGIPQDQIEVVVHPQSIIHSLVEFRDGMILAQLAEPDMMIPIQWAMSYPKRLHGPLPPFDFTRIRTLDFSPPDYKRFPCLSFAFEALKKGGGLSCLLNAANEVLVERFLQGKISWRDISLKLEKVMGYHHFEKELNLEKIFAIDARARELARQA